MRYWMNAPAIVAVMAAAPAMAATHADLVRLYDGFRTAAEMSVKNGVPDHGDAAMAARAATADKMVADLLAIDSAAWPVAQRADHLLVLSEARSVQFQHKHLLQIKWHQ